MRAKGKVAFVTGGSSGIGRATAMALAREGARVAIMARRAKRCEEATRVIEDAGGEVLSVPGDVSCPGEVEKSVGATVAKWGRLDIVVANAGINGVFAPIDEITLEEWNQTHGINIGGTFLTAKYSVPHLRQAGGGSIVVVSSVNGNRIFSNFGFCAYASSKAAQVSFAKMAAVELAQSNIRVNVVCPGATITNIAESTYPRHLDRIGIPREYPAGSIPLGNRAATAEEIADLIVFLISDEARYITGTEIYADGALSLFQG